MNLSEEATIKAFFLPSKQARYLMLLGTPERRLKSRSALNHFNHLDSRFVEAIDSASDVVSLLRSYGAPDMCRVISADPKLDGKDMPLREAVDATEIAFQGTIICCVPGTLAYYYGEAGSERLLLRR